MGVAMADPHRIATPRPSAQRLSEDIGDVLTAIRRLIAEDEALVTARNGVMQSRSDAAARLIETPREEVEDPAEALARRYGGNAALARQMAQEGSDLLTRHPHVTETDDDTGSDTADSGGDWPLGDLANAPNAPRPLAVADPIAEPHNDLARRIAATIADDDADQDGDQPPAPIWAPLKLVRPTAPQDDPAQVAQSTPPVAFDEDYDWKARMRPDPVEANAAAEDPGIPLPAAEQDEQPSDAAPAQPDEVVLTMPLTPALDPQPLAGFPLPFTVSPFGIDLPNRIAPDTSTDMTKAEAQSAPTEPESPVDVLSSEEQSIRELLREMIREELFGELGQRFSRNLRTVIRREVAVMIDDQLERL